MIDPLDPISYTANQAQATMRRRTNNTNEGSRYSDNVYQRNSSPDKKKGTIRRKVVRNLDIFPKVEQDLTVKTEQGGLISLISYFVIFCLVLAEVLNHMAMNRDTSETLIVNTSLSKKMQVNINITFPAIACADLHLDIMDVAGDSQIDIEETLVKKRLNKKGNLLSAEVIAAETNKHQKEDSEKKKLIEEKVVPNYCGPCYGAHTDEEECCNTCDDVVEAYKKKNWNHKFVQQLAEQCVREGKDGGSAPKKITTGEGCNLSGFMNINRVAGNFHVALGEGVERDGRHIHLFLPEDTPNFNASHIVHELSFGPKISAMEHGDLEGISKITTVENGSTGFFQYFIKVVPTTYKDGYGNVLGETNRYFFTERFRPLMTELIEDEHYDLAGEDKDENVAGVHTGGQAKDHHDHMNSILPGVFFIYEIYPFAVVVTPKSVPLSHLLIRVMALVGGVMTIVGWIDTFLFVRGKGKSWRG